MAEQCEKAAPDFSAGGVPEAAKHPGGRPRIVFDLGLVEDLGKIQSTHSELAAVLGVSIETVKRRLKDDPEFCAAYEKGLENGKSSLRRIQWKSALGGNTTMQIWLGKQYLGQQDRQTTEVVSRKIEEWRKKLQDAPEEVVEWLSRITAEAP